MDTDRLQSAMVAATRYNQELDRRLSDTGVVDQALFREFAMVQEDPNASSVGWLQAKLRLLAARVSSGARVSLHEPSRQESIVVGTQDAFFAWADQHFPIAEVRPLDWKGQPPSMQADPWLIRWLPLIRQHAANTPVLEIGCGAGADTATLVAAGFDVLAFDLSASAISQAKAQVPRARFLVRDVREDFPPEVQGAGVVIASLSLHYFAWGETLALFNKVRQTLAPGGLLVCRLNSTEETQFGASGHPEIEPNFYRVYGEPKRFFDRPTIDALFAVGWQTVSVQQLFTGKYLKQKALWEVICIKSAA